MADFNTYAKKLRKWEGTKFTILEGDKGGATNSGVTLSTFRLFYGADKTVEDLKRMTQEQWNAIMKGGFWDKCKADQIKNQSVAELFVDWCVNAGVGMIKNVQKILRVDADGIVGPKTLTALNSCNQKVLHYKIKKARLEHYFYCVEGTRIVDINTYYPPANIKWFDGWVNRTADFQFSA
jgi:lysozyme family protein